MTDTYKNNEEVENNSSETFKTYGEPQLVTVRMFEREYQIKSDQPQLVELLAAEINREAKKLCEQQPVQMGPGHFDWPVQVAFRLALARFRAQEAYNTLKSQVDAEAEKIARRINVGLGEVEAEKLARKITADLDRMETAVRPVSGSGGAKSSPGTGKLAERISASLGDLDSVSKRISVDLNGIRGEAEKIAQDLISGLEDENK